VKNPQTESKYKGMREKEGVTLNTIKVTIKTKNSFQKMIYQTAK